MAVNAIPVDTTRMSTPIVVLAPEVKANPETGEIKTDREGNTQYRTAVSVSWLGRRLPEVIDVTTSVKPEGITLGSPVRLVNLVARPWQMGDRSGVAFSAEAVTPAVSPGASLMNAGNTPNASQSPSPAPKPGKPGAA
jgi:hypothetical protein